MHWDLYNSLSPLDVVNAGDVAGNAGVHGPNEKWEPELMRIELEEESKRLAAKMNTYGLSSLEMLPEESGNGLGGAKHRQEKEL